MQPIKVPDGYEGIPLAGKMPRYAVRSLEEIESQETEEGQSEGFSCGCIFWGFLGMLCILGILAGILLSYIWYYGQAWSLEVNGLALACTTVGILIYVFTSFTVQDTTMNICNYWIPMVKYALTGLFGSRTTGTTEWFTSYTKAAHPYVGKGIGPNSKMYLGWEDVAKNLGRWPKRIAEGTLKRENELGLTHLNSALFPDTGRISLGWDRKHHAAARPYIAKAVQPLPQHVDAGDGSNGWNQRWLRECFEKRFEESDSFNTGDVTFWITIILHKIVANMDLEDDEAKSFCCQMNPSTGQITMTPPRCYYCPLFKCITGGAFLNCRRQSHIDLLTASIEDRVRTDPKFKGLLDLDYTEYDQEPPTLMANMAMDTLLYAGGLSVPTVIQFMLCLNYMSDKPEALEDIDLKREDNIKDFMWETLRKYCPVGCVPAWVSTDGEEGEGWSHEMNIIEMALKDERVFPEPNEFRLRRPGLNSRDESRSLSWAEPANVNGDACHADSRGCPAKELSKEIIIAFWQAFVAAGPWEPAPSSRISVSSYFASSFTLNKIE